jgi:hypothetical protein
MLHTKEPEEVRETHCYLRSNAFTHQSVDHFKVIKKCLFIFNEASVEWVETLLEEVRSKI